MKRSELLQMKLGGVMDAIQTCRDVVEGNFNAIARDRWPENVDYIELQARIYTDLEILAMNQVPLGGNMLSDVDPGDENDYREPASADR